LLGSYNDVDAEVEVITALPSPERVAIPPIPPK